MNALIQQAHKLPRELYKSMTRGRGKELADVMTLNGLEATWRQPM